MIGGWRVERRRGDAGALHGRTVAWGERSVTWCEVTRPAVVLGSTQPGPAAPAGAGPGLDVVRRRTGGGAVLVEPGRVLWADVVVPAGDPLWQADVGRAAWWLGEAWSAALASLGLAGGAGGVVHRGGLVASAWSAMVCFAGLGPGEVTVGGRKVVGLAQRRTREGALFQCALPLAWDPAPLLAALGVEDGRAAVAAELAASVLPLGAVLPDRVEEAFLGALP